MAEKKNQGEYERMRAAFEKSPRCLSVEDAKTTSVWMLPSRSFESVKAALKKT